MSNLISSQQALEALQAGPCRVAREEWPWGKWIESWSVPHWAGTQKVVYENDEFTEKLWEPEFADHSANDWYVLEERV